MGTGDLDLVRRCLADEAGAWDAFTRRSGPAIRRGAALALRKFRVTDPGALDNVHQQVYVELLRDNKKTLRGYQGKSDLEGWLAVVALRTAYHLLRKEKPTQELPEFLAASAAPAPGERAERTEFLDRLDAAFRKLEPRELKLLRLVFFEKLSYKDVAEALGMPLNSVSPLLIRAKDRLKKLLEEPYVSAPPGPRKK
ncbi:MAG TPA: sigma-70 family RNA polymerase sigma factor [Planctomycetota bacterium]